MRDKGRTQHLRLDEPGGAVSDREAASRAVLAAGDPLRVDPDEGVRLSRELSLELVGGPEAGLIARHALSSLESRVASELLDDMRLLVTELVTNSVRHSGAGPASKVDLHVSMSSEVVRIEVRDRGNGFAPRPRTDEQDKGSGWGLYLVDRLADRWGVAAAGGITRVWLELDCASYDG
jgi:anti-sigma regulatory factor (Ser/Thr protein kinase)